MTFSGAAFGTFFLLLVGLPIVLGILKYLCWFTTVDECRCKVFVLFGKVIGVIDEPGLHITPFSIGPKVLLVPFFGKVHSLDLRLDQRYLRSRAVNSEEGTPVGIGVWYEMRVSDPVAYLFENTDPEGSLMANVTNTTVRSLSNMPLENMMRNRHHMSREVRSEVSPKSESWGYSLGSVYIRKVHFRDHGMIHQIEQKVVNRLTQVTSAIRQAGDNQVDIIKSRAEREASIEFAKANAVRPRLVGNALREIGEDAEVVNTLFSVLETQEILSGSADVIMIPPGTGFLPALEAEKESPRIPPSLGR
ncbi:MAG: SPFH/Band 7/PHB domain protein [Verrucomicrobiales bacterium]|jgi:regulator of protease activity HflC (stomatin/prohibitin superfamily)|nr:SPFH/Band 7/PHB domain protein [Verrucomicrobiales bacterium]MBP9225965.1 SPFH/Band 7/PHB domain protein [Verrucomicrobiales bacterium]HQZ27234.1 SPFH domain-containing protein [Verrucomicrobiales bacterium]